MLIIIQMDKMSSQLTNFLKKQNMMLKQQNKELKTLLELNRQALKLSTQTKKGQTNFFSLIRLLYEQNSKLHKKVGQLTVQLQTGMCKALISEQIAFASTQQQKYLTNQLKDKLTKLRKQLQLRQKKITQLSKSESQKKSSTTSPQMRTIELVDFTSITKKLKDEINDLYNQLETQRQEVSKYKDQKQQLLKLNLILTKQINQYKLITSHQSTSSNQVNSGELSKFMMYQKKIIQDQDDSGDEDEEFQDSDSANSSIDDQPPQQPTKISKITKLDLNISKVPKLQLTKAKQIQQLIVQKINNEDSKKKGVVKEQKYKKIQSQLSILRKKLGTIMLQKMEIQRQNNFLKKYTKQLESRNQFLLHANQNSSRREGEIISGRFVGMGSDQFNRGGYGGYGYGDKKEDTETLLEICRDVTLNLVLRKVINGSLEIPVKTDIHSYDV